MNDISDTVFRLAAIITAVTLAGLALAAAAGAAIVRYTLRPLRRVAATATQVATMPLDRGEVALAVRVPDADTDPRTEVGQVGAAINNMLGHVGAALNARQASEMRVRRFVADASHELRTPLAAIRGYAELSRRSQEPVPDDVAHALGRVESQAVRMTGLVEDLLLLASLDSGRQLVREPVDLTQLLIGAVGDAHAAGPSHVWRLDVSDEPVSVIGENARLTQVVTNLLANARTHTPPETVVTVGLRTEGTAPLRERGGDRRRQRPGHRAGAAARGLRAVRPRRLLAFPRRRQHRTRPGDRRGGGRSAPRHGLGDEHSGQYGLHRQAPGRDLVRGSPDGRIRLLTRARTH